MGLWEHPRVEPDPLGAVGGPLAASFAHYSNAANNDNAAAGISGNRLRINAGQSFTLDAGYYYLTEFNLGANASITINSSVDHPVVIFLAGDFRTQPSSVMSSTSHSPRALHIFSKGRSPWQSARR